MKATAKARKHDAVCGRANLTAIDEMVGGIMRRFDSIRVNGASDDDWERLREDARDLSYALDKTEVSMYELAIRELASTKREYLVAQRNVRRLEDTDPDPRRRQMYVAKMGNMSDQMYAQVRLIGTVFDTRHSQIYEDANNLLDGEDVFNEAAEMLHEHRTGKVA